MTYPDTPAHCQAEALDHITFLEDEGIEPTDYLGPIALAMLSIAKDLSAIRNHLDRKDTPQ